MLNRHGRMTRGSLPGSPLAQSLAWIVMLSLGMIAVQNFTAESQSITPRTGYLGDARAATYRAAVYGADLDIYAIRTGQPYPLSGLQRVGASAPMVNMY